MKRNCFLILIVLSFFGNYKLIADEINIHNFLQNEKVGIGVQFNEKSPNLAGVFLLDKGHVSSYGNGTFSRILYPEYNIIDNCLEIYYSRSIARNFLDENKNYFIWSFPERLKVIVTIDDLINAKNASNHFIKVLTDTSQTYPTTCQAIVIDNLNVRDEPSLKGKKIGKLKKRDEVTLCDTTKDFDEINGEKYPWYKLKLNEDKYGWVYGGYVRIIFEDEKTDKSDKEKILESLKD